VSSSQDRYLVVAIATRVLWWWTRTVDQYGVVALDVARCPSVVRAALCRTAVVEPTGIEAVSMSRTRLTEVRQLVELVETSQTVVRHLHREDDITPTLERWYLNTRRDLYGTLIYYVG
jgi:hypothetical protein